MAREGTEIISKKFWVCVCGINNLHVAEEMRCQMCGVWNDSGATRHVYVDDMLRALHKYVSNVDTTERLRERDTEPKIGVQPFNPWPRQ